MRGLSLLFVLFLLVMATTACGKNIINEASESANVEELSFSDYAQTVSQVEDMSDEDMALVGEVKSVKEKTIGDEIVWDDYFTFVVNHAEFVDEGDRTVIKIEISAANLTSRVIDEYTLPFVLYDENENECSLDSLTNPFILSDIEGGQEGEVALYFTLCEETAKEFYLYLQPFGQIPMDVITIELE